MEESNQPSWLTQENVNTGAKLASNPIAQSVATSAAQNPYVQNAVKDAVVNEAGTQAFGNQNASSDAASQMNIDPEELKQIQKFHTILRVSYIISAILMGLSAVAVLAKTGQTVLLVFFSAYVLFFSCLICCFEIAIKTVANCISRNFGFMYTLSGRTFFIVFVAIMCLSLGLYGYISGGIVLGVLLLHIYILCRHPKFGQYVRLQHFKQ